MLIRILFSFILSLLLAADLHAERAVRSLLEMRQENLIIQQWDNSCGAAALATLLTYDKAYPVTEQQVAQGMLHQTDPLRVRYRGGFSLLDMQRYAESQGFEADGYSGMTLDDLSAQVPMIVPIRVRGYDHFVLVRRVAEHKIDIADPGFGNYQMPAREFAAAWPGIGFQVGTRKGGS